MALSLDLAGFQMPDACKGTRNDNRSQRRREDEARGVGADGIAAVTAGGNVTAHETEALGERAFDDVDLGR